MGDGGEGEREGKKERKKEREELEVPFRRTRFGVTLVDVSTVNACGMCPLCWFRFTALRPAKLTAATSFDVRQFSATGCSGLLSDTTAPLGTCLASSAIPGVQCASFMVNYDDSR